MSGITVTKSSDLDAVLTQGNSSANFAVIEDGVTTEDTINADRTILSGYSHIQSNLIIGNGRTWTINSGGWLLSVESLTVSGTGVLTINGSSRVV